MKYTGIKSLILCGLLAFTAGCTKDFDDINTNPNAPTAVNSGLLLPQIQRDMIGSLLGETWGIGNIVIQHTAKNQFVNEDRYLWGELNSIWNNVYDNMRDVNNIIIQSNEKNEQNYNGIALVMRLVMAGRDDVTASHHEAHHQRYTSNYGLYFRFWDKLCGTDTGLASFSSSSSRA